MRTARAAAVRRRCAPYDHAPMSVRELLPYGAVIGAGGVALLLVVRPPALRLVGLVLLAVGLMPLVLHEQPSIGDRLQAHPVLVAARVLVALVAARRSARRSRCAGPGSWSRGACRRPSSAAARSAVAVGSPAAAVHVPRRAGSRRTPTRSSVAARDRPRSGCSARRSRRGWCSRARRCSGRRTSNKGAFCVITVALPFGALAALVGSFGLERVAPVRLGTAAGRARPAVLARRRATSGRRTTSSRTASSRSTTPTRASTASTRCSSTRACSGGSRRSRSSRSSACCCSRAGRRGPRSLVLATRGVFVGLALSYSQSSLLALDVGLVVLAAVVWRGRAIVGFAGLAALVLLASLAVPTTRHKIFHTSLSGITSNRSSILSKGIDAFRRHPLAGSGLGSFARSAGTTAEERARIAPHNVVLQEAVELGVLGLIALAGIVLRHPPAAPAAGRRGAVERAPADPRRGAGGARGQLAVLRLAVRGPDASGSPRRSSRCAPHRCARRAPSPCPRAGRSGTRSGRPARSRTAGTRTRPRRAAPSSTRDRARGARTARPSAAARSRMASQTNG